MKHFCAKLNVKKDVQSIILRPRSVPFVIRQATEEEIKWLEAVEIIQKVPQSKWADPIVSVPKGHRKMKLSSDYTVTVNHSLDVDQYILPP